MSVTEAGAGPASGSTDTSFFGHPRGLAVLFFAEMWERFSYYGMRALLVLYLTQHFLFSDERAQGLYAAYTSLVYLMPVAGGFIADRYLGHRKAVTIGAVLLALGHFGMAFEGSGSRQYLETDEARYEVISEGRGDQRQLFLQDETDRRAMAFTASGVQVEASAVRGAELIPIGSFTIDTAQQELYVQILYVSLSLIIVGVGFLKANISTIVGALYDRADPRRDRGFTIFYMGINLGSLTATILCGWLGISYGWKYGFGLAGFGMLAGLITFVAGRSWLEGKADPPDPDALKRPVAGPVNLEAALWIAGLIALFP
ncbi:MAG: MFS transporter, partial [Caulobacterales bacterium]|nr:MFS transporter [Caulobacterales bacterium]